MTRTDQELAYLTFSYRVKDATSGKHLVRLSNAVNTTWNYVNEISERSARRSPKWATKKQLRDLTKGASKEVGLPSQVIQEVIDEFIVKRKKVGRPKLRWRVSHGRRRSLGWVPFTNQDVKINGSIVMFRGRKIRLWKHREIQGQFKSGNFSQDARGRWFCNIVCEIVRTTTNRTQTVGIDLGHKTAAQCSDGQKLQHARYYRDLELKLAEAQRRGRKRQVRTIHAKIAKRRKDALHKFSRAVVTRAGAVFVGNISSTWQIASGVSKATLDASWSMLRNFLKYKCDHAGVVFAEVDESYSTQTCSECSALSGPRGREGLAVRHWVCGDCGSFHDRDRNAALNIARLGCETLGLKGSGSLGLMAEEVSQHHHEAVGDRGQGSDKCSDLHDSPTKNERHLDGAESQKDAGSAKDAIVVHPHDHRMSDHDEGDSGGQGLELDPESFLESHGRIRFLFFLLDPARGCLG
jgi:IS605 OrfB family transposase